MADQDYQINYVSFNKIRKNDVICVDGRPCKIVSMSTAKPGKHGAAKAMMDTLDIFTGKKTLFSCGTTDNVQVPEVKKQNFQVVNIDDEGYLSLFDPNAKDMKEDIVIKDNKYLDELMSKLEEAEENDKILVVTVMSAMGTEKVISHQFEN